MHLLVVNSAFSQLGETNDIFHTFTKIGDKNCKVNVDCASMRYSPLIEKDGLKTLAYSNPFRVP